MRPLALATLVGLGVGLALGSCTFQKDLEDYCAEPGSGCECANRKCCISDGHIAAQRDQCCPGLNTLVLQDGGVRCCSGQCLGASGGERDASSAWADGDGGLGTVCTTWQDCWHDQGGGWACAYDGGGATCQQNICWVVPDGGLQGCGSQNANTGVVALSTGTNQSCGLPGYVGADAGGFPCCYGRLTALPLYVVSCLEAAACSPSLDGGPLWVSTLENMACPR